MIDAFLVHVEQKFNCKKSVLPRIADSTDYVSFMACSLAFCAFRRLSRKSVKS